MPLTSLFRTPLERPPRAELVRPTSLRPRSVDEPRARALTVSARMEVRLAERGMRAEALCAGLQPDVALHIASRGELSLHDVIVCLARAHGPFEALHVATWAASLDAVRALVALRDAGHVQALHVLCDARMPRDAADAHAYLRTACDRYECSGNHAKVFALTAAGSGVSAVATCNLTYNPRCEALVLSRSERVARFHRSWIEEVLTDARSDSR